MELKEFAYLLIRQRGGYRRVLVTAIHEHPPIGAAHEEERSGGGVRDCTRVPIDGHWVPYPFVRPPVRPN